MIKRIGILAAITLTAFLCSPSPIRGFNLPCYITYQGKVIDADTLKPVEGVVVMGEWRKCWPGIGGGMICSFKTAKEVLTDENGEWSITGPEGRYNPGFIRGMLSFIVSWTKPPRFYFYKPGYCNSGLRPGYFKAFVYINKGEGLEGIVLDRPGKTQEEIRKFSHDVGAKLPFKSAQDPVTSLRNLDFLFQYSEEYTLIPTLDLDFPHTLYMVIALKEAETRDEWLKAKSILIDREADLPIYEEILKKDNFWPVRKEVGK